jgi:hypothetical protein
MPKEFEGAKISVYLLVDMSSACNPMIKGELRSVVDI